MKILLTGSTGYIGRRLLTGLLADGHYIICLVRDKRRFDWDDFNEAEQKQLEIIEVDLTKPDRSNSYIETPVSFKCSNMVTSIFILTPLKICNLKNTISD